MTFHNTEAITCTCQRLSTHLMLEPGITWATKVTTSWPEPQLFLKCFWRTKREARDLVNTRASWDPHSKPGLSNFLLKLMYMIYQQLPRFLSTVKQTKLETQDLFVVNCHRKYHFTGAQKAAESLRLVPFLQCVNTAITKQKCHQQWMDFRRRRKKITHSEHQKQQEKKQYAGWSRGVGARTLFLLYLPLQHRVRNTTPIQIKQFAYSAVFFSWAASSLQAAPCASRLPSRQLKTSERKEKEKGVAQTKAWFSAKRRAHTPENMVTVGWARCWQVTLLVVVGLWYL